jgi:hypothetical protein
MVTRRARDDGDVWLGLRIGVERQRELDAHGPSHAECRPQLVLGELDGHGVRGPLRLHDDQASGQELDGLVLVEQAQLDQPGVLLA